MVQPSTWWHPGLYGCNSDASRPQGVADNSRRLGGDMMQFYLFGEWSNEETALFDISTLELIAVGYLVAAAATTGQLRSRMVIRCDNEAACRVINDHCEASVAMSEAVMMLEAMRVWGRTAGTSHSRRKQRHCGRDFARQSGCGGAEAARVDEQGACPCHDSCEMA